jgi:AraC-like DNA-binding protein
MTRARFDRAFAYFGWQRTGCISYGADGCGFFLKLRSEGEVRGNGRRLNDGEFVIYRPGAEHFGYAKAGMEWVYFMVPPEVLERTILVACGGEQDMPWQKCLIVQPDAKSAAALRDTACRVLSTLRANPRAIDTAAPRRAMEQSLLDAFKQAMINASEWRSGKEMRGVSHWRVVSRAREYFRSRLGRPIYMPELSKAVAISDRSLRMAFYDLYGVSPNRYLKLLRLTQVRRELRKARPDFTTVMETATRCGFWDMGRFAVEYKQMFGESPSHTLRKAAPA